MPDAPDPRPAARRLDPGGRPATGPAWETLIDRQVRLAIEAGAFDDLPHRGERLPDDDNPYEGEWALAHRVLRNAGMAPPWIETDREVRHLLGRRDALLARAAGGSAFARRRDRAELERLVTEVNAAIARLNAEAPTDRQHRVPLDPAREVARYDAACTGDAPG